ncbi:MAG: DUF4347 domain-containing protein, partial [Myxococcales bacterium]|nr:DUF4347 domain-containing protein [Myxococcales bacterium]
MSKKSPPNDLHRPLLEELEGRILLSADIESVLLDPSLIHGAESPESAIVMELSVEEDAASRAAAAERRELVFVDSSLADHEKLLDDLLASRSDGRQIEVVLLDASRDGIAQIGETLAAQGDDIDAVHVISHGSDRAVQLGDTWLGLDNLGAHSDTIAAWSDALSADADLLFYGCNLAGGADGRALIDAVSDLTGADVAASVDLTGSALLGGDWDLEYTTGGIEATVALSAEAQRAWGAVLPAGGEFRVNTTTSDSQQTYTGSNNTSRPVAMDADGDFVAIWQSLNQDGAGWGIYGQRYDATGAAQGAEFRVNSTATGNQEHAAVAMDDAGNFVVVWMSDHGDGDDIYGQRYDASGAVLGSEFLINQTTTSNQANPEVAMDASGNFVAVWESNHSGDNEIYSRRYDAAGTPLAGEVQVNTWTANNQNMSSIAMDDAGNYVVVWNSYGADGDGFGVFAQRYDAAGVAQGSNFQVNTTTTNSQERASVAMDSDGDFVVVWMSTNQDGSGYGVYAQRYNAAGVAQGAELAVNTETADNQRDPAVAMNANGDFTVSWSSRLQDGSGWGIYAQDYDSAGTAVGAEFRVNTTTASDQKQSGIAMDDAGDYVVVWTGNGPGDASGVFAQRYGTFANAAPVLDASEANLWLSTSADVAGSAAPGLATWTDGEMLEFG